ncbi:MAG: hypothetical protein D6737_04520 [Chloroflexi bacterium]|nr:MAG: hypothetical protein CUN54_07735 [Phototrophicales bacterium]RMF81595.1 MAG: hypothetical protein D6737_04520 [Chloroflexota bacterium]
MSEHNALIESNTGKSIQEWYHILDTCNVRLRNPDAIVDYLLDEYQLDMNCAILIATGYNVVRRHDFTDDD